MMWRGETWQMERTRLEAPHRWFAWKPVQFPDGSWHWLEYVTRRGQFIPGTTHWRWDYGP